MGVHAMDLPPISGGDYGRRHAPVVVVGYDDVGAAQGAMAYATRRAGGEGVVVLVAGSSPQRVADTAAEYHADEIVVARRDAAPQALIAAARCPVVVVPADRVLDPDQRDRGGSHARLKRRTRAGTLEA